MPNDRLRRTYKTADNIAKVVVAIAEEGIRDVSCQRLIEKDARDIYRQQSNSSVTVLVVC